MINIGDLLGAFREKNDKQITITKTILDILEKEFFLKIKKEDIKVRNKTIYLKVYGPAKTEITTQKKKILEKINTVLGENTVLKIN